MAKKRAAVVIIGGVMGLAYIIGGGAIVTHRWARSYYHWLGADWHMDADMGAFMVTYSLLLAAFVAAFYGCIAVLEGKSDV